MHWIPGLIPRPSLPDSKRFHYPLPVQSSADFSFVVIGDTGMNSPGQYLVSTAISRQDLYPSEFCLILGDVIYPAGGEEGYPYGLLEAFKHYNQPVLAIPGNHDWYDSLRAFRRYFVKGHKPSPSMRQYHWQHPQLPNWYYHMDVAGTLRIICLDTGISGEMNENRKQQLGWLDRLLESAQGMKVLVMLHHPLYSLNGRSHERGLRELLEPRFQKAHVIGVFSGHDHNYQRHSINGRQYIIQGAGGATLHPVPSFRILPSVQAHSQEMKRATAPQRIVLHGREPWDQRFSFTHCRWHDNRLTCTTVSAHELPGRILDRFVL